jgi:CheY-like chemotaxis protein
MEHCGRILIADDEEIFLHSTADLLRREGYECECVQSAPEGVEKLKSNRYDVLVADINMPGNPDLDLIRQVPEIAKGMSSILVTGYPSSQSAIDAVGLDVSAYLVKPIDFDELLETVRQAIGKSRLYNKVLNTKDHLRHWQDSLSGFEDALGNSNGKDFSGSIPSFLDLTFGNLADALSDIRQITAMTFEESMETKVCNLVNCPKLSELEGAIEETISVLQRTKGAFKSKELGDLRKKLEAFSKKVQN